MARLKVLVEKSDALNALGQQHLSSEEETWLRRVTFADQVDVVWARDVGKPLTEAVRDASFMLTENGPITADVIAAGKQLRFIQNAGGRYPNVDVKAARRAGVPVAVISLMSSASVAEHAIILMLALSKKLLVADRLNRAGHNPQNIPSVHTTQTQRVLNWVSLVGSQPIYHKTLGIIGMGDIGSEVAKRARAFEMRLLYYQRHRLSPEEEKSWGVEYRSLQDLVREVDILTIHCPFTPETERMIGAKELRAMKPGAFLINTARGNIVDQDALYEALKNGLIAGAGLDVFKYEPAPADEPLFQLENVVVTPHLASGGTATIKSDVELIFANVGRSLRGEAIEGVVNQ